MIALAIVATFIGMGVYIGLLDTKPHAIKEVNQQTASSKNASHALSSSAKSHVAVVKKPKVVKKCYGLQLIYVHENYMQKLFEKEQEMRELGFSCHINYGKRLPNNQRQVFLVCETRRTKKELQPIIEILQGYGIDYAIVRDSCKNLQKNPKTISVVRESAIKSSVELSDNIIKTKKMTLQELQKLYSSRKSYDLAIKIAQSYYEKGAYAQAMEWAKRANKLNRQKEEAWILYAKTLYKLGKKEKAKQLLKIFLEYKDSQEAKQLLKKWQ